MRLAKASNTLQEQREKRQLAILAHKQCLQGIGRSVLVFDKITRIYIAMSDFIIGMEIIVVSDREHALNDRHDAFLINNIEKA